MPRGNQPRMRNGLSVRDSLLRRCAPHSSKPRRAVLRPPADRTAPVHAVEFRNQQRTPPGHAAASTLAARQRLQPRARGEPIDGHQRGQRPHERLQLGVRGFLQRAPRVVRTVLAVHIGGDALRFSLQRCALVELHGAHRVAVLAHQGSPCEVRCGPAATGMAGLVDDRCAASTVYILSLPGVERSVQGASGDRAAVACPGAASGSSGPPSRCSPTGLTAGTAATSRAAIVAAARAVPPPAPDVTGAAEVCRANGLPCAAPPAEGALPCPPSCGPRPSPLGPGRVGASPPARTADVAPRTLAGGPCGRAPSGRRCRRRLRSGPQRCGRRAARAPRLAARGRGSRRSSPTPLVPVP